jgi:O-antigen/teichoic acid export membrane protein
VLALRGGADLVALWAQLGSLIEVVAGVALAGLGTGLAVYVARTSHLERQRELLREAFKIGLIVALPFAVAAATAGYFYSDALTGGHLASGVILLAAAVGWIGVLPGLVGSLWQGQQRRDLLVAFALVSAVLSLVAAALAPAGSVIIALLVAQAIPALVVVFIAKPSDNAGRFRSRSHPLRRYVLPSIAIGLLSPGSALVARAAVGDALSWHDAGVMQGLWRLSDWVGSFAGGILSFYFLPQLAAAGQAERFRAVLRAAAKATLVPAALVLAAFCLFQEPLLNLLYSDEFRASNTTAVLIFIGGWIRIASWVAMFGLYAQRRTIALTVGEFLSLPLFAALVLAAGRALTLEMVGVFWLLSYCAYLVFNCWALRRSS